MKENAAEKIATYALYAGAVSILAWALLKSFHVIQSPVWVEMIPFFGGGVSLLALAYHAGKLVQKVDEISERLMQFETRCDARHAAA